MQTVTINGVNYNIPNKGESPTSSPAVDWGVTVTQWIVAVSSGLLQKAGGSFTLTADVDFGATFGLKPAYIKDRAATIAAAGFIRLPSNRTAGDLAWRNAANTGDCQLYKDASDDLIFNQNGTPINISAASAGNVTGPGSATDNAITRFNGTSGQSIQNSPVTIDDNGLLTTPERLVETFQKLTIGLEFEGRGGGAATTTDVLAKFINQGGIINAASLSTADVVAADFDSANKKFGNYSLLLGTGNIAAFPGQSCDGIQSSLSTWFRNLSANDYIAYNPLLGIEVYLDGSGFLNARITEKTAATESTKNTTVITGAADRRSASWAHAALLWRGNDAGGASTDLAKLRFNGATEGSDVTASDIDLNVGDCGTWFLGAKRNDPVAWDHFYAASGLPTAHSSPWTLTGTAGTVSNGVLTIATSAAAGSYAKTGAPTLTGVNLAAQTIEIKCRLTASNQRTAISQARFALFIRDDSLDKGIWLQIHKNSVAVLTSTPDTCAFEMQLDTSQFHVYRLTSTGSPNPTMRLYVDGVLVFEGANTTTDATANDFVRFGTSDVSTATSETEWIAFADEVAAPIIANTGVGNLDSFGVANGIISDAVIAALQTSKVTDVFGDEPSYGISLPPIASFDRTNTTVQTTTATFSGVGAYVYYLPGDGITEHGVSFWMEMVHSTAGINCRVAIDVDGDFVGLSTTATGGVPYGAPSFDQQAANSNMIFSVSRKVILPPGLHTLKPVYGVASGTLNTTEATGIWERFIAKDRRLP